MNVGLRELRVLLALERELSFTDAAIALGVSQAAVSRTLARLEREVGRRLVRRTTRSVELTSDGRELAREVRGAVAAIDAAVARVREDASTLRIGHAWAGLGALAGPVRAEWQRRHPGTRVRLVRTVAVDGGLGDGRADVAVLRAPRPIAGVEQQVVGAEPRVAVVAADDPLVGSVVLADLLPRTIAVDRRTGSTSESLWSGQPTTPRMLEIDEVEDWLDLIAAGAAVGVTSAATLEHQPRGDLRAVPISDAPELPVALAWAGGHRTPVVDELAELLRGLYAAARTSGPGRLEVVGDGTRHVGRDVAAE